MEIGQDICNKRVVCKTIMITYDLHSVDKHIAIIIESIL